MHVRNPERYDLPRGIPFVYSPAFISDKEEATMNINPSNRRQAFSTGRDGGLGSMVLARRCSG